MNTDPQPRPLRPRKPSLRSLLVFHQVDPAILALQSHLPLLTVEAVMNGYGTTPQVAEAILKGLNTLNGTDYTLDNISVELHPRQQ
jgi:hypothetical protein